jgi:hypothetical protein
MKFDNLCSNPQRLTCILENSRFQKGGLWFRRIAGVAIAGLVGYFIIQPFVGAI